MTAPHMAISVIACTRNRCDSLQNLLSALTRLEIAPELSWELVIVNNGSTDGTAELLDSFAERLPIRQVFEPKKGLSTARNAGLRAALGEVLAFTDDDCIPAPNWVSAIHHEFAHDPRLDGLGGRVELYDKRDSPITIRTSRERETLTSPHQLPALMVGCNMAFRRSTIDTVGQFDTTLGAGTPTGSAEDTDYLYRALRRGLRIEYVPEVHLAHDHGRRDSDDVLQLRRSYARGRGALLVKYLLKGDRAMASCAYAEVLWNCQECFRALRTRTLPRSVVLRSWHMLAGAARWVSVAHWSTPIATEQTSPVTPPSPPTPLASSPAEPS